MGSSKGAIRPVLTAPQMVYLDVVRALAANCVLVAHILYQTGDYREVHSLLGPIGVTVFFLLSGFLIDLSAQRCAAKGQGLRSFLIDRTARIYVCYLPALTAAGIAVSYYHDRPDFTGEPHYGVIQFIGNVFMLQDHPALRGLKLLRLDPEVWMIRPYSLFEQDWTVSVEFFLYAIFGAFYFLYVRRDPKPHRFLQLLIAFSVLPVMQHAAAGWGNCLTLIWILGVIGSRIMGQFQAPKRWELALLIGLGAALMAMRWAAGHDRNVYDLSKAVFGGMILLGGIWSVERMTWLAHPLIRKPAAFFANTSYALYLTHAVPIGIIFMTWGTHLTVVRALWVAAVCHVVAFVFWWLFDRHHKRAANWLRELTAPRATSDRDARVAA
jgi:peptidoglycan/LPS O-acetylase OafA/YrhL